MFVVVVCCCLLPSVLFFTWNSFWVSFLLKSLGDSGIHFVFVRKKDTSSHAEELIVE
jgi:hypothetical protein